MLAEWVEVSVVLVGLEEVLVVVANISTGLLLLLDHGRAWGLESRSLGASGRRVLRP